ncbi:hypothetical protein PS685_05021 [Pseudomonas fluorescens]|uniref:Uncharacterized protein n=1 Tax=Pseudomonas fluorescens TaxID=294 RepID=A0A5E7A1Q3_PSEFL|nr:hypothetical protein PS685_05021 [Pseudomonas fluorescens]
MHAGDHQRRIEQAEDRATNHRRQVEQHDHPFGDEDAQVSRHRADHCQRQHAGDDDGGDRHHQQLHRVRHPRPQPFLDDAHDVGSQQDRQDLPLVAHFLDLEQAQDVEVRQALPSSPATALP